jgi:hypothetical protein
VSNDQTRSRHISIRIPGATYRLLEAHARERDETVSQTARRLLADGLAPADRDAIDAAIAALQRARTHVTEPPRPQPVSTQARVVNVLNVKTNLSRLLADVGRGDEIVISHAGHPRARLVPIPDAPP